MGIDKLLKDPKGPGDVKQCPPNARQIDPSQEPSEDGDCVCDLSHDENGEQTGCYRYAAYANRFKTAVNATAKSGSRYLAYTSDVGESFRPVVPRFIVRLGYAVSWAYVVADVSYQTWKAKMRQDGRFRPGLQPWHRPPVPSEEAIIAAAHERSWKVVAAKEMAFQSVASMGLPAFTIHTIVKHSGFMFKCFQNPKIRKFGPVANGLAIVPLLPYMYDKPVEHAVEWMTETAEDYYGKMHGEEDKPKGKGKDL